jgi:hypothetical protein
MLTETDHLAMSGQLKMAGHDAKCLVQTYRRQMSCGGQQSGWWPAVASGGQANAPLPMSCRTPYADDERVSLHGMA